MIAGIIAASYKFIDGDFLYKVREWIKMTGLERIFDDLYRDDIIKILKDRDEALKKKDEVLKKKDEALKEKEEEKIEALNELAQKKDLEKIEAVRENQKEIARNMIKKNIDIVTIMDFTGLTKVQIQELKKQKGNSVN